MSVLYSFLGWDIISLYINTTIYHSLIDKHLGHCHLWAVIDNASVDIHVSVWPCVFISLDLCLEVELLVPAVTSGLTFEECTTVFYSGYTPFIFLPAIKQSFFLYILGKICFPFFNYNYLSEFQVVSHCDFDLHIPLGY